MHKIACATLFFSLVYPGLGRSSDNDELLEQIRLAHRVARQSIRQFSCSYSVRESLPTKNVMAFGKYARSGEVVSIKDGNEGIGTQDMLLRGGSWKTVSRSWKDKKIEYFAAQHSDSQFFSWGDVWQRMMIDHTGWEGDRCNFDRVIDRIAKNARLSRVRFASRDCILIEAEEKTKQGYNKVYKMWLDINHNYLVRKAESYDLADPTDRTISEVTEFQEPIPGILIPVKCRVDSILKGQLAAVFETVLSDIQVNLPIPDSTFVLPAIPKGTQLQDSLHGTRGPIGSDWKAVGPTVQHVRVSTLERSEVLPGQPTQSESWTLNQYLLYGSLLVFVLCIAILLLGRQRASGATAESLN